VNKLSIALNDKFDPFWNVIAGFSSDQTNNDLVLYGYAFNNHWFWYNGITVNYSGYIYKAGMVIWKDYNCHT
jgi:hypothetical protein